MNATPLIRRQILTHLEHRMADRCPCGAPKAKYELVCDNCLLTADRKVVHQLDSPRSLISANQLLAAEQALVAHARTRQPRTPGPLRFEHGTWRRPVARKS